MRRARERNAILKVLKAHPEGLTAGQICYEANNRHITSAKHVSNLVKGMAQIKKMTEKQNIGYEVGSYKVNIYYYDDEGAEI